MTPAHGDTRNRRTETNHGPVHSLTTPQGTMSIPLVSVTQTVSEKWCETCQAWVTAKGIMGGLLCVICDTPWNKAFRTEAQ